MGERDFFVRLAKMKHVKLASDEATGAGRSRTRDPVPGGTGWRKVTPGLARAEAFAEEGVCASVPKARAFVAVKRVGCRIGLKPGDMLLLDTLAAFTQAQDWEDGRRPVVWASNATLMARTGFSLSALKRHARRLSEAGVIAFRDSPNGKRWGRRDERGVIVEAYGVDLSPLAARAEEFEALHAEVQAEERLSQALRRQITVSRRMIRARLEAALHAALSGPWRALENAFEALLAALPRRSVSSDRLEALLDGFRELQGRVETAYLSAVGRDEAVDKPSGAAGDAARKHVKMAPREVASGPHIQLTNQPQPVTCNRSENERAVGGAPELEPPDPVKRPRPRGVALDVPTLLQACPEFAGWARDLGGYLKDWRDAHRVAAELRPMIGVTEPAWRAAEEGLGRQAATAAMALVFDKHATGEVASPGGYLRGMVGKAGAGELHLERSIYGRLSGRGA